MSDLGNKQIMAENIRYYMEKKHIGRRELCEALGFKYSTVTDWLNAEKYPRIDKIEMMANYFRISKADLVERHVPAKEEFSAAEREHLQKYRALSKEHQEAIDVQLDFFYKKDTTIEVTIQVDETGERAALLRRLDEELEKENREMSVIQAENNMKGGRV